jgi:hypothetical protein
VVLRASRSVRLSASKSIENSLMQPHGNRDVQMMVISE